MGCWTLTCGVGAEAADVRPAAVRDAQAALGEAGHDAGPADGALGPRTRSALQSFQRQQGLPATGRLDPETVVRLDIERRVLAPDRHRVREVQEALKDAGHDPGPADGLLGPRTRSALRSYAAAPAPSGRDATSEPPGREHVKGQSP
jgi:peptidoglycan hydrolase-like protein with peptidoglycan-binding domain